MDIRAIIKERLRASGCKKSQLVRMLKANDTEIHSATIYQFLAGKSGINSDYLGHILDVLELRIAVDDANDTLGKIPIKERIRAMHRRTHAFSSVKRMKYIRTPKDVWEELNNEFHFTLDACASHKNHLCEKYYTEAENGNNQDWTGEIVYCHPMFDRLTGQFVEKAADSKCTTVMLLPASTHSAYFHNYIYNKPNVEVRYLRRRSNGFAFGDEEGNYEIPKGKKRCVQPLMIVIFRNEPKAGM